MMDDATRERIDAFLSFAECHIERGNHHAAREALEEAERLVATMTDDAEAIKW